MMSENRNVITVAFDLDILNLSMILEAIVSMSEIAEVKAANKTRIKNNAPMIVPVTPICLKIDGREINIRLGPAASKPSEPWKA